MNVKDFIAKTRHIWKRWIFKIRLNRFYMYDQKRPRSLVATIVDFIFIRLVLFSIAYLWFVNRTKSTWISLGLAFLITILISFALYLRKQKVYETRRLAKRRKLSRDYLLTRLIQLNHEDFQWQLMQILLNTNGFSNINNQSDYMEAQFNGKPMMVGFHHIPHNEQTSPREVWDFIQLMHSRRYRDGLFISSATFKDGCEDMVRKRSHLTLHLIDGNQLLDMMEKASMLPSEEMVDQLVSQEIENSIRQWRKLKKEVLTPRKIKSYLLFAVLFLLAGLLIKTFSLYYYVLSLLFFVFALFTYIVAPKDQEESNFVEKLSQSNNSGESQG